MSDTIKTNTRDIHSPANIKPDDYEWDSTWAPLEPVDHFTAMSVALAGQGATDAFGEERRRYVEEYLANRKRILDGGYKGNFASKGTCDHCGAYFKWGAVFKHIPSGEYVVVGWICADETFEVPNRAALDIKRQKERAAGGRERLRIYNSVVAWVEDDPTRIGVIGWLISHPGDSFYSDLFRKLFKYGPLSERQEAAVRRGPQQEADRKARAAAEAARKATAQPVPQVDGRLTITGEVVSTKWVDTDFGSTLKLLVVDDRGFKVWGSCPSKLDIERGVRVRFDAKVTRSDDDPTFGFYSRPTRAAVLEGDAS